MKKVIEVVKEQHFIEGDRFFAFLHQGEGEHRVTMILARDVKPEDYFSMTESLGGLKIRLEMLGNQVETKITEHSDPNFETAEDAAEYMDNH